MTSQGRTRQQSTFVVTGNKNGVVGLGLGKAVKMNDALRTAKNKAGQQLMYVPIDEDNTGLLYFIFLFYFVSILLIALS